MKFKNNIPQQSFWRVGLLFLIVMLNSLGWSQVFQLDGDPNRAIYKDCDCIQLTPNSAFNRGFAWNLTQLDLSEPFDLNFKIYLGVDGNSADGMAFVLQRGTSGQTSDIGGGLGYAGISPSLAVQLDTEHNGGDIQDPSSTFGLVKHNHISLHKNGGFKHGSDPDQLVAPTTNFPNNWLEDGIEHDFRVTWDPNPTARAFTVFVDGDELINYNGDIVTNIFGGDPLVTWGFTAASGQKFSEKYFCTETLTFEPVDNVISISGGDNVDFSSFNNIYTGTVDSYSWDFGDGSALESGTNSSISRPTHTYSGPGNSTAILTFNIEGACEQTQEFDIVLGVEITASPTTICSEEEFELNIIGSASDVTASPVFSGSLSDGLNTISLTETTTFTINNGVSSDDVTIAVAPTRNLTVNNPSVICEGEDVSISTPQSSLPNYQWQASTNGVLFADIPETSPSFNYTNLPVGDYFLRYYSQNGSCADTSTVASFSVLENPELSVNSTLTTCSYNDATITVVSNGTLNTITDPVSSLDLMVGSNLLSLTDTTEFTIESSIGMCSEDETFKINVINDLSPLINPIPDDQCVGLEPVLTILTPEATSVTWQVSHDGVTFVDTLGVDRTYNLGNLPLNDYYFRALFAHDGCEDTSTVEYFRVFQALELGINAPVSVCESVDFDLDISHDGALSLSAIPAIGSTLSSGANTISLTTNTTFTFSVTDAGCVNDTSISVTVLPPTAITQNEISDICFGEDVLLSATRNDLPNYQWQVSYNGSAFNDTLSGLSSYALTGLPSGNYAFRFESTIGGCENTSAIQSVEVKSKPALSVSGPETICAGEGAQVEVLFSGLLDVTSSTNFTHSFVSGLNSISPPATSSFDFTVSDNGCDSTVNYRLEVEELVPITVAPINNSCDEDIVLSAVSTSSGPFTWQVDHNGSGVFTDTLGVDETYTLANLNEGSYDFRVSTTANGCLNTSTVESFTFYQKPDLEVTGPVEICEGENASLNLSFTGALGVTSSTAFAHSFVTGNNLISPPATTSFEFTATANGCDSLFIYDLAVVPTAPLNLATVADVCSGEEVNLSADQKGLSTYEWQVANGNGVFRDTALLNSPDISLINLSKGRYQFRFQSGRCANTSNEVSFVVKPNPVLTLGADSVSCAGTDNLFTASTDRGLLSIENLTEALGTTNETGLGLTYNLSSSLLIEVRGQDNGCQTIDTVNLRIIEPAPVSITGVAEICAGEGELLTLDGVFTNPVWRISRNSGVFVDTLPGSTTMDLSTLKASSYVMSAKVESNGCEQEVAPFPVEVFEFTTFSVSGDAILCLGETAAISLAGSGPVSGLGSTGNVYNFNLGVNNVAFIESEQIILSTSVGSCEYKDTLTVEVYDLEVTLSSPQANADGDLIYANGLVADIDATVNSHPFPLSYDWSFNETTINANSNVISEQVLEPGTFNLSVTSAVCSTSVTLLVLPEIATDLVVPTLFTPNGDGDNDVFVIEGLDLTQENHLTIKNRWGTNVWGKQRLSEFWDGTYNGNPVPEGTYYYIIENGNNKSTGYITVLR